MTEFQKWNSSLRKGGFEVITTKVAQEQVANFVNENNVSNNRTHACPGLKLVAA
jgi:D-3-phosphoglycerate dehydrogenase